MILFRPGRPYSTVLQKLKNSQRKMPSPLINSRLAAPVLRVAESELFLMKIVLKELSYRERKILQRVQHFYFFKKLTFSKHFWPHVQESTIKTLQILF